MDDVLVRHCGPGDYDAVVRIYNHYIEHSPATFDVVPYSVGARAPWFSQFSEDGPHQLLVAAANDQVLGYCCSTRFKARPAYDISVETTAYVDSGAVGRGLGKKMYTTLLARLGGTGVHGAYAGVTLPNDASVKLHENLGFTKIGNFAEVGRKFDKYWSVAWFQKRL
jgi:phosphinothricin acetyltransferase